jgi:hypothetical protein
MVNPHAREHRAGIERLPHRAAAQSDFQYRGARFSSKKMESRQRPNSNR